MEVECKLTIIQKLPESIFVIFNLFSVMSLSLSLLPWLLLSLFVLLSCLASTLKALSWYWLSKVRLWRQKRRWKLLFSVTLVMKPRIIIIVVKWTTSLFSVCFWNKLWLYSEFTVWKISLRLPNAYRIFQKVLTG